MNKTAHEKTRILRVRMIELGLTSKACAQKSKLSAVLLSKILTGANKEPSITSLKKLSKTLGIALVDLFNLFYS